MFEVKDDQHAFSFGHTVDPAGKYHRILRGIVLCSFFFFSRQKRERRVQVALHVYQVKLVPYKGPLIRAQWIELVFQT